MRNRKLIIMFSVLAALVLLVVVTGAVFSVQHIDTYCYNADDTALEAQVRDSTGLKKGRSIFVIDEDEVARRVEESTGYRVKVINIERKFPNRVSVNYVKIMPYAYVTDGTEYYEFGNNLLVTGVSETEPAGRIRVLHAGEGGFAQGEAALTGEAADTLTTILDGFVRLGYSGTVETEGGGQAAEMCDMVDTIDLRFASSVYIKMRAGVTLELVGRTDLFDKLRLALTAYVSKDEWKTSGTIIVSGGTSAYTAEDRYGDALAGS